MDKQAEMATLLADWRTVPTFWHKFNLYRGVVHHFSLFAKFFYRILIIRGEKSKLWVHSRLLVKSHLC